MKVRSPDRMVASCHTETMASSCHSALGDTHDGLMTQSLDPNMLSCNFNVKGKDSSLQDVEGSCNLFIFFQLKRNCFIIYLLAQKHRAHFKQQQN